MKNNWIPRHTGKGTFCSPACGAGCSIGDYELEIAKAERLAETLGEGWEVEISENLGWHSKIVFQESNIELTLNKNSSCDYTLYYDSKNKSISGNDAIKLIDAALKDMFEIKEAADKIIRNLTASLP
jgi:hypothetical protein